jgi:hypothetical protein
VGGASRGDRSRDTFEGAEAAQRKGARLGAAGVYVGPTLQDELQLNVAERAPGRFGRPLDWHEVEAEDLRLLIGKLAAANLPGEPRLQGIMNMTGDYAVNTSVRGAVNDRQFGVRLSRMEFGYDGVDARAFASLMRTVLSLAKLDP